MNFSHGSYDYHQSVIDNTRKAVARKIFDHLRLVRDHSLICDISRLTRGGRSPGRYRS